MPDLTVKQASFAAALAGGASIAEAARLADVSDKTGRRYSKHPDVQAEVDAVRARVTAAAEERMTGALGQAADNTVQALALMGRGLAAEDAGQVTLAAAALRVLWPITRQLTPEGKPQPQSRSGIDAAVDRQIEELLEQETGVRVRFDD